MVGFNLKNFLPVQIGGFLLIFPLSSQLAIKVVAYEILFFLQSTLLQFTFFSFKIHYKVHIHCFFIQTINKLRINVMQWPINKMLITTNSCIYYISFSDFLTSGKMKLCRVVALFLIGVIPVKITHVYSLAELHWGARGSGRPPKITQFIDKSHSRQLVKTLPHLVSSIDRSPAEIPRDKPSIAKMPDDSRKFYKQGFIRDQKTRTVVDRKDCTLHRAIEVILP